MNIEILDRSSAIAFLRANAALFDKMASSNAFSCSVWVDLVLHRVADDSWKFIAIKECTDAGEAAILLRAESDSPLRLGSTSTYYSSLYNPIVTTLLSPANSDLIERVVAHIDNLRPRCASLNLEPIDCGDADNVLIADSLRRKGWYVKKYLRFGNWYLPCTGLSFESYMQNRPSQLINTWKRKKKHFSEDGSSPARVEILTSPEDVPRGMDAYEQIYAKSWKNTEPYPAFIRDWASACAERGWLRLGLAWEHGTPIAAQLWFTLHGKAYIFKLAYDEEYSRLSAGTVLSALMFRYALDIDRVSEIDYLTGDDDYKKAWVSERRQRTGMLACNQRSLPGLISSIGERARGLRKKILKSE